MKKNFLLAGFIINVLILATSFTSCSKDDDGGYSTTELAGTWYIASEQGYEKENGKTVDEYEQEYTESEGRRNWLFIFQENGECSLKESGYTYDGHYSVKGNKLTISYSEEEPEIYTIAQLTGQELVLEKRRSEGKYESYGKFVFKKSE